MSNARLSHMASDNAMTEIALALAMAFFSIMILTMVSMGAGDSTATASAKATSIRALPVQAAAPAPNSADRTVMSAQDIVVVWHRGAFYDSALNPVNPETVQAMPPKRIVLAISPDLPMAQALDARSRFASPDVIVTTLSTEWINRLKEISR